MAVKKDLYWISASFIDALKETNFSPYVYDSIKNLTVSLNKYFAYKIPNNTFISGDGNETLSYTLQMKNGKSIPKWLIFNIETLELSGTPTKAGEYNLIIKVVNINNASIFGGFTLRVQHEASN